MEKSNKNIDFNDIDIEEHSNLPTYKIHGQKRREMKRELSKLKLVLKDFWHDYYDDIFMYDAYGCNVPVYMSKENEERRFEKLNKRKEELEEQLSVLYGN